MQLLHGLFQVGGSLAGVTYTGNPDPFDDCNVYALTSKDEIVLIDCGNGETRDQVFDNVRYWGLDPADISTCLITHAHWDHAGGAYLLKERGVTILAHPEAADAMAAGDQRCCGFLYHKRFIPCQVDRVVNDGEIIRIGNLAISVLHLPGHTMGCVGYLIEWEGKRVLFSGDVIGTMGYGDFGWSGSIDFNKAEYLKTLQRLATIEFDVLLGGHGLASMHDPLRRVETSLNAALMQWR